MSTNKAVTKLWIWEGVTNDDTHLMLSSYEDHLIQTDRYKMLVGNYHSTHTYPDAKYCVGGITSYSNNVRRTQAMRDLNSELGLLIITCYPSGNTASDWAREVFKGDLDTFERVRRAALDRHWNLHWMRTTLSLPTPTVDLQVDTMTSKIDGLRVWFDKYTEEYKGRELPSYKHVRERVHDEKKGSFDNNMLQRLYNNWVQTTKRMRQFARKRNWLTAMMDEQDVDSPLVKQLVIQVDPDVVAHSLYLWSKQWHVTSGQTTYFPGVKDEDVELLRLLAVMMCVIVRTTRRHPSLKLPGLFVWSGCGNTDDVGLLVDFILGGETRMTMTPLDIQRERRQMAVCILKSNGIQISQRVKRGDVYVILEADVEMRLETHGNNMNAVVVEDLIQIGLGRDPYRKFATPDVIEYVKRLYVDQSTQEVGDAIVWKWYDLLAEEMDVSYLPPVFGQLKSLMDTR